MQARTFSTMLALGALTALTGCSGGGLFGSQQAGANQVGQNAPVTAPPPAANPMPPQTASMAPPPEPIQQAEPAPPPAPPTHTASNAWANVPPPVSHRMVQHVQQVLRHDGTYNGHIDGIWGPRSTHAMQQFQSAHHLRPNGQIDLPTLAAMNLPNGNARMGQANTGPNGPTGAQANAGPNGPAGAAGPNAGLASNVPNGGPANAPGNPAGAGPNAAGPNAGMANNGPAAGAPGAGSAGTQTGANYSTGSQNPPGMSADNTQGGAAAGGGNGKLNVAPPANGNAAPTH